MVGTELLEIINDRKELLSYLSNGPAHKRDIIDNLEVSRSTVDRAISKLMNHQLVKRREDGYIITKKGELGLSLINRTIDGLESLEEGAEFIDCFPIDANVLSTILTEGDVFRATPPSPIDPIDRSIARAKECDKLAGPSIADNQPEFNDVLIERASKGELELELIFEESLAERQMSKYEDAIKMGIARDNVHTWVSSDIEFCFFIFYMSNKTFLHLVAHGQRGNYLGHIESSSSDVIEWAENHFKDLVAHSTPFKEVVDNE